MPKLMQGFKDGESEWFEGSIPKGWSKQPEDTPNEGTVAWLKLELTKLEIEFNDDALKPALEKLLAEAKK